MVSIYLPRYAVQYIQQNIGKNQAFRRWISILLIGLASVFSTCAPWDKSDVKIERFEYLDIPRSTPVAGDSLSYEAYLIHGYSRWHEKEIHEITVSMYVTVLFPIGSSTEQDGLLFLKRQKTRTGKIFR